MVDRRIAGAFGALVVVALLAGVGFFLLRSGDDAAEPVPIPDVFPTVSELSEDTTEMQIDPAEAEPAPVEEESDLVYAWQPREIGGGGWVKGMEIHPSGEPVIARTDVGGAYRFDRARGVWDQLILEDRVPGLEVLDYHVEAVAIAPTDPDRIYLRVGEADPVSILGRVLVSSDGGQSWTRSDQIFAVHGNGPSRNGAERIAVSTTDPDDVWMGGSDGLWRSQDGGLVFDQVSTAPTGTTDFEAKRGIEWVETDDGVVYIGVAGSGVHRSLDDGATWELLWSATERPFDVEIQDNGVLWAVNSEERIVRRYDPASGEITEIDQLAGEDLRGIAVRPDGSEVVVAIPSGYWVSTDGGASWDRRGVDFSCGPFPWHNDYPYTLFTASSPEFDPLEPDLLWQPEGFGIWVTDDLGASSIDLTCRVTGVEELVVNDVLAPARDVVIAASWDRALFYLPPGGGVAARVGPTDRFNSGWHLATTPAQPGLVAAVVGDSRFCCEQDGQAYLSGVSRDNGATWEPFASYENGTHPPELRFGNIAISSSDPDTMVWLPTFNFPLHRTVDGGATWTPVILPGTEDRIREDGENEGGSHFQYFLRRTVLQADPIAADTFYLFHQDLGLYRSTDGGATWAVVSSDGLPTGWTAGWFNAELVADPGVEGHLLYTPGRINEAVFPMYESVDGGENWREVPGTSNITAIGFGAPLVDGGPQTAYIVGELNSQQGIWRSGDGLASWELVDTSPGGLASLIYAITGDPEIPGRVYVGIDGISVMQGDPE